MQEFVNTFQKGLNSDMQIIYQPDGTWRYLKNCDVISQDGNNYAIKDCLGNTLLFSLNIAYNAVYTVYDTPPTPLAFISFPDRLIVLSTNNEGTTTGGYLEIGEIKMYPYGEGIQPKSETFQPNAGYTPLYHHASLNCTKQKRIEGFAFSENELINRIYWTDNFNPPRVFNVSDPVYSTYFATGTLVNGSQYMVLQGAIEYPVGSGNIYGPGLTLGNVFTAGATAAYTATSGTTPTPLVIGYTPYQLLDWTPQRAMAEAKFKAYGAGNVLCGNKIYFTRLLTADSSYATTWSYGTWPIHVGTENSPNVAGIPAYHNFVGGGSETATLNSGKSVVLSLSNVDTTFGYVELACAEYDQLSSAPRQITVVARERITSSTMDITHDGNSNFGDLTIDDVTLFPASILKIKTLNTNKNYNLIGNITERKELDLDLSGATVTSFQYPMNCHSDIGVCGTGGMNYTGAYPSSTTANPGAGAVKPWSRYVVVFGDNGANTVTYNGNNYVTGEVITGVSAAGTIACAGTAQVRPCVTRNRYTTSGGARVENAIPLTTGFWTYKDPAAHHHVCGYRSGEKYRYALIPLDLRGNPFYGRFLSDYIMPSVYTKGGLIIDDVAFTGETIYSLNASGVKFSNISFPAAVMDQMSGFMIVRAERDPITITQGLVTQVVHTGASPDVIRPAAWSSLTFDGDAGLTKNFAYLCPDILDDAPLRGSVGVVGDKLVEAQWISPYLFPGGGVSPEDQIARAEGGREQVYTKYVNFAGADASSPRSVTLSYMKTVDEGSITSVANGNSFINGLMEVNPIIVPHPDDTCIGGGLYDLGGYKSTGCKKTYVTTDADFPQYLGGTNYGVSLGINKILMNYQKANKSYDGLYGGLSDSAKANTLYMSTGHYQPITAQVKADTYDAGSNTYIFNDVEVFGGDCFLNLVDIGYALWDNTFPNKYSYAWTFPCECESNYELRRGRKTSNVQMYYTGTALTGSIVYLGPASEVRLEAYSYNKGYSADDFAFSYPALPVNYINASQFKQRIRFAGPKIFGEIIDSFRVFLDLDFKDLSGQSGRINNIKVKKDIVVVWQDLAINTVPILQREQTVSDTSNVVNMGTGGVVDRYDVLDSYFGNQHQWGVTETEFGFAWFDMHRKSFMIMDFGGGGIAEVSLVQGLQSFFNEAFVETGVDIIDPDSILNSQDFSETSDRPLMGVGITGVFDPKSKMTYMCFKFKARRISGANQYWNKDFTIGYRYDDREKFFVGFYDCTFAIGHNHNQWAFTVNNPKNNQYLAANPFGASFVVGDTFPYTPAASLQLGGEYICIVNVTLDNVIKFPDGADGTTYWKLVNKPNQIWAHNQPTTLGQAIAPDYQYNKFFGKVVNNEVSLIVNPANGKDSFFGLAIEQETPFNVNYTTITIDGNNSQTAQDANIRGTDNNYRFTFNRIKSSLMRMANGARIYSNYLKITFTKKNYTTDPTVLTTSVKILQSLKTFFGFKK